jgi:polar amino acid transport system substrate-binding protein
MRNPLKYLAVVTMIMLGTLFPLTSQAEDTLQRIIDFKVLNVGMTADQPPMNTVNRNGNVMGFDVDVARALAKAMRVKLDIKIMPFSQLMEALEKDEIDMIISGMAITPERTEQVSFVGPYMMSGKSLLTKDSVLARAREAGEFNRDGLKLLALKGSTSVSFVQEVAPEANLVEVSNYDEAVASILKGEADALVADMPVCELAQLRHPDQGLVTLPKPLTIEPIGIAISKDDVQLFNLVDNYLETYERMGLLNQLRKKWFEDSAWISQLR